MQREFRQVDVFTTRPYAGNPVAVVLGAEGLGTAQMQGFARWTNLSETTFVLPPENPAADYRVRIFTPAEELPFAGHPTLGTCHAWLATDAGHAAGDTVVQECAAGLIPVRRMDDDQLAFAAPPLLRSGPVDAGLTEEVRTSLGLDAAAVLEAQWVDNGPGWLGLLVRDAEDVLAARPGPLTHKVGVVGPYPDGAPEAVEVRAFFPVDGVTVEDPVTGSLNASLAQWLLGSGRLAAPYVASQGIAVGRRGRVHVDRDPDGTIWIGGGTVTCIRGTVEL